MKKSNYQRASNGLNGVYGRETYDLVNAFASVTNDPVVAARTGAWFWRDGSALGNLNSIVDRNNQNDQANFESTIRGVRGGGDPARIGIWNSIRNVIFEQNAYGNMSQVLKSLGIFSTQKTGYSTKLGISLNKRVLQTVRPLETHLVAQSSLDMKPFSDLITDDEMQTELYVQIGEVDMLVLDSPGTPPQVSPTFIHTQATQSVVAMDRNFAIGVCHLSPTAKQMSLENDKKGYYSLLVRLQSTSAFAEEPYLVPNLNIDHERATVTVLKSPKHGRLSQDLSPGKAISYYPDRDYSGEDKVIFSVNIEGRDVKMVYFIKVNAKYDVDTNPDPDAYRKYCPWPNPRWLPDGDTNSINRLGEGFG